MKVYLYGIQGVYNYGCEAMVRGISEKFKKMYPKCQVIYKTSNLENDEKSLADCETVKLEAIENKIFNRKQRNIIYRGIRFIKKKLNIAKTDDYIHINTDWTHDCDVLVIIGGDVFDLIPSQKGKKYRNDRISISKMVKENGGKVILWGISVGSFESDLKAKNTLMDYFKNTVDFAGIRDKKSCDYLKSSGVDNIKLYSDPAYMLRTLQCEAVSNKEKILGINISPLSNRYLKFEKTEEQWIDAWTDVVQKIYRELNFDKIILIPHVVVPNCRNDDDLAYLKNLYSSLNDKNIPVLLVDDNAGFFGVKKHLIKCHMLLSARMHCSVNAITCGVPTVFLSYSPKSIGMCEHVYGNDDMFFDMNDLISDTDSVISKLKNIDAHNAEIREYLKDKNVELYENACEAAKDINKFLKAGIK